jgi:membrane-associated phospholipid phosphatase
MKLINIADLISVFPLCLYYVIAYLILVDIKEIKKNFEYPIIFIGLVFSSQLVSFIKSIDFGGDFIYRPKGAQYCDYLSKNKTSKMRGFPSGHMSSISLFATFMILLRYRKYKNIKSYVKNEYMYIIVNLLLVIATAWARYYKKCHTLLQIGCGTILGILLGYIFFVIYEEINRYL